MASLLKYESKIESKLPKGSSIFYPNSLNNIYIYNDLSYVPIRVGTNYNTIWNGVGKFTVDGVDYVVLVSNLTTNMSYMILRLSDLEVRYIISAEGIRSSYNKVICSNGLLAMIESGTLIISNALRYTFTDSEWTYSKVNISINTYYLIWETPTGIGLLKTNSGNYCIYSVNTDLTYQKIEEDTHSFPGNVGGGAEYFSTLYQGKTHIFRAGYIDIISYNQDGSISEISHNVSSIPTNTLENYQLGICGYRKDNYVYLFNPKSKEYHKVNLNNLQDISIHNYTLYPSCIYFIQ